MPKKILIRFSIVVLCWLTLAWPKLALALAIESPPYEVIDQPENEKPNVVVILSDDQGWADIGYNNPNVYTPNLDRLAKGGVIFKNHYVMPQCTPTRIAFFTGRYPSRFGPPGLQATNEKVLNRGTFNIARLFNEAGYQTGIIGKWHLGSDLENGPNFHGFDYAYGALTGAVGNYDHRYRTGKHEIAWHRNHQFFPDHENGKHTTDLIADDAVRFINVKRKRPFFLYVPFTAPHTPLDERGTFVDTPTKLDPSSPKRWLNEDKIRWFNDPMGKIQREKDPEKRLFLAAVHHLDDAIGQIVNALDESGQRSNTLILFSSDNGPQINWPGNAYPDDLKLTNFNQPDELRGSKCDVWEGGIHVPGFANWPGKIQSGRLIDQLVHIIDWLPTMAKLLGQHAPDDHQLDGMDISPYLFEENQAISQRDFYWVWRNKPNRWSFRSGNWKMVRYGTGEPELDQWQLFNVKEDPQEKNDLADLQPERIRALHEKFKLQRSKDKIQPTKS